MAFYSFTMKTNLIHGKGALGHLPTVISEYRAKRVFLVTDKGLINAGICEQVTKVLDAAGLDYSIYSDVKANPPEEVIEKGLAAAKEFGPEILLALGGGSSIDTAKGISILYTNGGKLRDYEGPNKVLKPTMPIIAIPTTCGSGSEVTWSAVITDAKEHFKFAILSRRIIPEVAIADPNLLVGLPRHVVASTGVDALTHAVETFVSSRAQPISDIYAVEAIKLINDNLRQAVLYQDNLDSLEKMLYASSLAGIAFTNGMVGLAHAIAHPLGGVFDVAHGVANAILLPHVMKFNLPANQEKFARIGQIMSRAKEIKDVEAMAYKSLEMTKQLSLDVGIPGSLKEVGVDLAMMDKLVDDTMKSGNVKANPRISTRKDIEQIITNAYNGVL